MSKEYVNLTDSCYDLSQELVDKSNIEVFPLQFEIYGKTYNHYPDGREYDFKKFYVDMRAKKIARTSQITPSTFIAKFEELLKKTYNIMLISFGSALSGTYNSACTAAGLVKENHPEANIIVIDSLCASCGQGLLVYLACKNRDEGMSMEENTKWIEDNKLHIAHWFTVDDLGALKRGGRLTATKAALATALGIKPVLHVDDLGRLIPMVNTRGRKKAIAIMLQQFKETAVEPENQVVFVTHGDDFETAQIIGKELLETYHVKEVVYSTMGPIIGAHTGANCLVIAFYATKR